MGESITVTDTPVVLPQPSLYAWHFLPPNGRMHQYNEYGDPRDDGPLVEVGKTYHVRGLIECCRRGLHASINPRDALSYAPGPIVQRVWALGQIDKDKDKIASSARACIWLADATTLLNDFAFEAVEALFYSETAAGREPKAASLAAVEAKRKWLQGSISDADLETVRHDARIAADTAYRESGAAAEYAAYAAAAVAQRYAWVAARAASRQLYEATATAPDIGCAQGARLTELLMKLAPAGYTEELR